MQVIKLTSQVHHKYFIRLCDSAILSLSFRKQPQMRGLKSHMSENGVQGFLQPCLQLERLRRESSRISVRRVTWPGSREGAHHHYRPQDDSDSLQTTCYRKHRRKPWWVKESSQSGRTGLASQHSLQGSLHWPPDIPRAFPAQHFHCCFPYTLPQPAIMV